MSRDKIVIVNHYSVTPDQPGGTRHYDLCKYLAKHTNYDIELWFCGVNHHTGDLDPSLKGLRVQSKEERDGFTIVRLWSTPYRTSSIARQINIIMFDLLVAIKILFSKNIKAIVISVPPISIFNTLATKLRNIKLIADVEDLWPLFLQDMGLKNKLAISYMNNFSKYLYNKADAVTAVSNGMLEYIEDKIEDPKMSWLSPLGVNLNDFNKESVDKELIFDMEWKDDFKIMYIGAHGRANDLLSVLRTAKEFNKINNDEKINGKKISFIFIGDGDQKQELINTAKELELNNVYFEDAVPGNMVAEYLKHADVCLTNLKKIESFKLVRPNKIFQYMALNKPILCGIWGEAADIVEEADAGVYIDFTEHKNAAEKIKKLIHDSGYLEAAGNNGRVYIEKYGDREKIFEEFKNKLDEVINN